MNQEIIEMTTKEFEKAVEEGTPVSNEEMFVIRYNALCKEMGLCIKANPQFKLRDDGTFSVVVSLSVATL